MFPGFVLYLLNVYIVKEEHLPYEDLIKAQLIK